MSKIIVPLFLWTIFTGQISAECMHSGELYLNGSSWNPDRCSSCTCQDPIAICSRKRCTGSACDHQQGKRLVFSTGSCCPVCQDMRNSCQHDGKIFENDAVWDVPPCMTCHCKWGRVDCTSRKCPTVHCLPEETLDQHPGECCPKCVQTKNSCLHDGRYHLEGSSWIPILCTKCFCQNGQVKCIPVQCPSLVCPTGQTELPDGECCPQCTAFTCKHGGQTYQEGDSWQRTPCEACSCIAGEVLCIQNQCDNTLSCPSGQVPWKFPGECCPECVDPSGQCDEISPARTNKEIWQNKGCKLCQCNRGNVQCQKALCPRISCQEPFVEVHKEEQCCPECILPRECEFNGRTYKSGNVWQPDTCSLCSCNNGDVSCYQQTCTVCPPNTYHIPTESSCCGYCQPYKCALACLECLPDQSSVCTKCANPDQFVHNGECLDECPSGYYESTENLCKKCHESCLSCSKGGPYYCKVCKSGLLYLEGRCVSQCPEEYHLQNWRCQACHRSCRTCIGPEMGQCLSCALPGQLLFKGRCVDRCPPAMYVENKHCLACPRGCLKCSATSKKCLVCADDAILHNGDCILSCPDGFYTDPDGSHCIVCHPGCLKCDGKGEDNCVSCHGGAQLRDGTCHLPCSPGYYRTYEGHCKACHDGCELCHLDPNGRDSNCISCINGSETPSGSKCVPSCGRASQYLQNGFCRDCSTGCLSCTNEWVCEECQLPRVLSDGKCVIQCAPAEYIHVGKGQICNGCSPGCSKCNDTFNCFACFDGFFLKNNAECVEDCGADYYSNSDKRVCEENSFAPEIRVVDQLLINGTGETGSLLDIVEVLDADTLEEDLIIYLVKPPEDGSIVRIDHGKDVTLSAKDSFFLREMKNNRVLYVAGEDRMTKDFFVLKASDRQLFSEEVVVQVVVLPDGEIELVRNKPLAAVAGQVTSFTGKNVDFISEVPPEDVTLTILTGPFHGTLAMSHEDVKVFTLQHLQQGVIFYRHDGSSTAKDSFVIQAYDGYNILNTIVDIHIRSKESKKPILVNNKIGYVKKGQRMKISSEFLKTVSADQQDAKNGDMVYTLVPFHNNPRNGDLIMVVPALHNEHEEDEGWQMMDKNQMSQPLVRFRQRDIDEGRIWYKHRGGDTTLDTIHFEVADTSIPPHVLSHQEFQISVSGSTELGSNSEDKSKETDGPFKESPVLVTEQLFVKEDHSVTLTNSSLSVIGVDHRPLEVIFNVDKPPLHGFLKKKQVFTDLPFEAEALKKGDSFTYKDILGSLVLYTHEGNEETTDSFTLNITNGAFFERAVISVVIGVIHDETPRVAINDVLRIQKGSTETITSSLLKSTDVDTDDSKLIYKLFQAPDSGSLRLNRNGITRQLTTHKPHNTFTQTDIDKGLLEYSDDDSGKEGIVNFKFSVADPQGNELLNQRFYINILDDRSPPNVDRNEELILPEGGSAIITTTILSASDANVNSALLNYTVNKQPKFGHLEFTSTPGISISVFKQSDLIANKVKYVHTRPNEVNSDSFLFSVSDGQNKVVGKFSISLIPVGNSIPVVLNNGMRVQEGIRKLITEFDLKAIDNDTRVDQLVFQIVDPTWHGLLQLKQLGVHHHSVASSFTMEDIYENRLSYLHDGSDSRMDFFKFTVNDGTNFVFSIQDETGQISSPSAKPRKFEMRILPVNDGGPILERNLGLQFLENGDYGAFNVISKKELKFTAPNTDHADLVYVVTTPPKHGRLQNNDNPESFVSSFTQEDVNRGKILYILTGNSSVVEDHFVFDLRDSQTNIVPFNTFHIYWSIVNFEEPVFNISETGRIATIPIVRVGNLKKRSVVTCVTRPGSATSMKSESVQGTYDFVQHSAQIHFDEWQDKSECVITINDDPVFEGEETFYVELRTSADTLIGEHFEIAVSIFDLEDEPVVEFIEERFHVNETDGYLMAGLRRKGDISQAVSVICSTTSMTAIGSTGIQLHPGADFIGREETNSNRVVIPQDQTLTTCPVKIIDDNIYEAAEHFELLLSAPSSGARLGSVSRAVATIDGPNDESLIFFSQPLYVFNESAGIVEIDVYRSGSDQTHTSIVWCATRLSSPLSAMPRQDYVPVANQITFRPGQATQKCQLTILDDNINPKLEGNETFEVFLSSPVGSNLHQPFSAVVLITDFAGDVAILQFENSEYEVDEKNSSISVPIIRSGDTGYESSVICYTRQDTAEAGVDFKDRRYHPSSTITFKPGEMTKNCTVFITDDITFEKNESFTLLLSPAFGDKSFPAVVIGEKKHATIVITNSDDVPRVQFKEAAYSIAEPKSINQINTVIVQVIRTGDINQTSSIRCSTRDASAVSGLDYNAQSVILYFEPGIKSLDFAVDVLYNSEMEWHESFTILLGPEEVVGAELGEIHSTTVTILDNKVSGSIVFPAVPVVVSLLYYDDVEKGLDINPSPGYPLVCVTPCDPHYPAYQSTQKLCQEADINSTQVSFKWEAAYPTQLGENTYQPFVELTDNTLFTKVTGVLLDSVYFRPRFRLRCSATPLDQEGKAGIRLKSNVVEISPSSSICRSTIYPGDPFSYQAQSFVASLKYIPTSDSKHPNTIEISVTIPHQDGMLPLVSTMPLNNIKFLLSDAMYRQQHVCSNLMVPPFVDSENDTRFFSFNSERNNHNSGSAFPYRFDKKLRTEQTLQLYRHLNLKSCTWTFRAWYHMTDLVDQCGGKILTNFKVEDSGQSFLTVRVPLYVSYLYASAPVGWSSLEHHTEMQFSFYYQTVLWKTGLEENGEFGGQLQVLRIAIGEDGHLVIDFRTQANFRGLYVLEDPTQPLMKSRFLPQDEMSISFDLVLLWSEQTYESPKQLWRATSHYNRKDYTGQYIIELLPCTVEPTQKYVVAQTPMKCTAHKLQRFQLPISFKQTNRPVPVKYSLNTRFQLTNNEKVFSSNPGSMENSGSFIDELDYNGAFSEGQKIYGRVLWNPNQDLSTAYELSIKKVYICTGKDGYIPTYDPTGEMYKEGSQFGCVQPNANLKDRFLVLDRDHNEKMKIDAPNFEFGAKFVDENSPYSKSLKQMSGVDGFEMPVDPLYKINSGHQWYLQVLYVIGPAHSPRRVQRSAILTGGVLKDVSHANKNGTNMRMLLLDKEALASQAGDIISMVVPGVALFILLLAIIAFILVRRHFKRMQEPKQAASQSGMVSSNGGLTRISETGRVNKGGQHLEGTQV